MKYSPFRSRLKQQYAIFTAEGKAIEFAFEHIKLPQNTHFTIFSDSLCLQSLYNMNIDHNI